MRRRTAVVNDPDDVNAAEAAALRILGGASQAAAALERRLRHRGFSASAAQHAVQRCRELGYVDDAAFAMSLTARQQRAGHGRGRVVAELRKRGIDGDDAAAALGAIDEDAEEQAAAALAQKLYDREAGGRRVDDRTRHRIAAALQRRGFGSRVITHALRRVDTETIEPAADD
ncbi:MAG: regulatory protein RecX [Candidatus Dormibacteria bacterium]